MRPSAVTAFHTVLATSSGTTHRNQEGPIKRIAKHRKAQAEKDFLNVKEYGIL